MFHGTLLHANACAIETPLTYRPGAALGTSCWKELPVRTQGLQGLP